MLFMLGGGGGGLEGNDTVPLSSGTCSVDTVEYKNIRKYNMHQSDWHHLVGGAGSSIALPHKRIEKCRRHRFLSTLHI